MNSGKDVICASEEKKDLIRYLEKDKKKVYLLSAIGVCDLQLPAR
jgi:hypothetical protein